MAEHERALLDQLYELAAARTPILTASTRPSGLATVISLRLPGWQILMAGVARAIETATIVRSRQFHLEGAGRYAKLWWLKLGDGEGGSTVFLGSHLRLHQVSAGDDQAEALATAPGRLGNTAA